VTDVVTGAYSYTGRFIASRLLADGRQVRTLSRRPRGPDDLDLPTAPLQFKDVAALVESLRGAETLYNTYWIRFAHAGTTFDRAVENTRVLFRAALEAGVGRIVHISVTKACQNSPYPYFRGKAAVEQELSTLGLPYAIVRPTLVFGPHDILVNNIAWILRRFPLFLVPGRGEYCVQPVAVEDVAALAVEAAGSSGNPVLDAAGPDTLTFDELVRAVRAGVGSRARIVHSGVAPALGLTRLAGLFLRDIVLTRDEALALMDSLLVSEGAPTGSARFGDWLAQNAEVLGRSYVSELTRNWEGLAKH
jgi:nucleoside-diphosphate-sugar epimerase